MPPMPGQAHAGEVDDAADPGGVDALDVGERRVVGDRAHGLAGAGKREEQEKTQVITATASARFSICCGPTRSRRSASRAAAAGRSR